MTHPEATTQELCETWLARAGSILGVAFVKAAAAISAVARANQRLVSSTCGRSVSCASRALRPETWHGHVESRVAWRH
jgi:hypothetical protein